MSKPKTAAPRPSNDVLPEVVLTPVNDNTASQRVSRLNKQGLLRPLYRGVYTSNLNADDEDVVRRNWSRIFGYLAPGAVISHRSAFDAMPKDGLVYMSRAEGRRDFELPGLTFKGLVKPTLGPIRTAERQSAVDVPYQGFFMASPARAYLD